MLGLISTTIRSKVAVSRTLAPISKLLSRSVTHLAKFQREIVRDVVFFGTEAFPKSRDGQGYMIYNYLIRQEGHLNLFHCIES